ncbi:SufE family protein [Pseudomonas sp. UL073]|uniref:SufE family protein n=1 Tax=Zestomonas insulae TaxID=2809017 RepID=A0ABS2ID61_9GAMM|nr:SufE family protein [Pseudomonas insulae]MBM7059857.1 SufE family protein [Pseudomonas insulae]
MSLPARAEAALTAFTQASGWEQRARLLMHWGEQLEALSSAECNETNRVHGCESQVWLIGEHSGEHWRFRAASDARVIRGLLAVLLARVEGLSSAELLQLDLDAWFAQLGLGRQLSPSRSNGLHAVLQRMRALATGQA